MLKFKLKKKTIRIEYTPYTLTWQKWHLRPHLGLILYFIGNLFQKS